MERTQETFDSSPKGNSGNQLLLKDDMEDIENNLMITPISITPKANNGQEIVMIKELDSFKDVPLIKVRVVRLWENPSNDNPNVTYSIDLILMDEEGNKIMARVWNQQVTKFKGLLKEHVAYYIKSTINKSQDQLLSKVGLFLRQPVFSHGQPYVALSRVKSREGLKLLIFDKDDNLTNTTLNVVYKEVFRNLR